MRKGYFTPPVLIILAIIIFAVAIVIAINADFVKRLKTEPSPTPLSSSSPTSDAGREPTGSAEMANWKTYTNSEFKYSLKYPPDSKLIQFDLDFVEIGDQITIIVSDTNPENCRGDCPFIELAYDTKIGEKNARKLTGSIGGIGGAIPQSFQSIVLNHNNLFYDFTLYELRGGNDDYQNREPGEIPENKIELFDQILSTFRFLE